MVGFWLRTLNIPFEGSVDLELVERERRGETESEWIAQWRVPHTSSPPAFRRWGRVDGPPRPGSRDRRSTFPDFVAGMRALGY